MSQSDVLVCGLCHTVFHFIEHFKEHKNEGCSKESTFKDSLRVNYNSYIIHFMDSIYNNLYGINIEHKYYIICFSVKLNQRYGHFYYGKRQN